MRGAVRGGEQRWNSERHVFVPRGEQQAADLGRERLDDGQRERQRVILVGKGRARGADQVLRHVVRQVYVEAEEEAHQAKSSSGTITAIPAM